MRDLHGLHFVRVDARPDDVAVFAQVAVLVAFFVEDDGARLADQLEAAFRAVDQVEILFAGEVALRLVGIERTGCKDFSCILRGAGLRGPFRERAGEILRDGAAHVGNFDTFVVERVHQVGGELLPAAALIAFEDHIPIIRAWPVKTGLMHTPYTPATGEPISPRWVSLRSLLPFQQGVFSRCRRTPLWVLFRMYAARSHPAGATNRPLPSRALPLRGDGGSRAIR